MVKVSENSSLKDIGNALAGSWGKSETSGGRFVALGNCVLATSTSLTFPFSVSGWTQIGESLFFGWIDTRKATK